MKRSDGRKVGDVRPIKCQIGLFNQADGSAYMHQGKTKVMALVYGPHEVRSGKDYKAVNTGALVYCQFNRMISSKPQSMQGYDDKTATKIKQAFESTIITSIYPRTQIDIFIEVLESDGSDVSVSINAASLALVDAGIQMKGVVCSCSVTEVKGTRLVDPSWQEQHESAYKEEVFSMLPFTNQIVMMEVSRCYAAEFGCDNEGMSDVEKGKDCMELVKAACKHIFLHLSEAIKTHHFKNNITKTSIQS